MIKPPTILDNMLGETKDEIKKLKYEVARLEILIEELKRLLEERYK